MKRRVLVKRVTKEILRDPLALFFGIVFPVVLLLLLSAIQQNVPAPVFDIASLTPGICVFGLSFLSLFSAQLLARDRATSMLARMMTAPVSAWSFILGYTLPLLPMALVQGTICYGVALLLGLTPSINILWAILGLCPVAGIFIGIGLLCGTLMSEKAATSITGTVLTNLTAFLSGAWFSVDMVGDAFAAVARALPFCHAVDFGRALLVGDTSQSVVSIAVVIGYVLLLLTLSILVFHRRMRSGSMI